MTLLIPRIRMLVLLADRGQTEEAREHFAAIIAAEPDFLPARQQAKDAS